MDPNNGKNWTVEQQSCMLFVLRITKKNHSVTSDVMVVCGSMNILLNRVTKFMDHFLYIQQ